MASGFTQRLGLAATLVVGLLGFASGCAHKQAKSAEPDARTVAAQPTSYDEVWVEESTVTHPENRTGEAVPPPPDEVVGYEQLSSGDRVEVVTYVHTYPEPIDTYPRVYWSSRWYYNVNGDFVFWSPAYGWVYYWGPPVPLVACWNAYYPWAVYSWGVGYYGPGWYWGGVGYWGYHAYGASVVDVHHHHHHHYAKADRPSKGGPTKGGPSTGGPTDGPNKGGPTADAPHRKIPGAGDDKGDAGVGPRATAKSDPATRARGQTNERPLRTRYVTPGGQQITEVNPGALRRPSPGPRESRSLGTVTSTRPPPRETGPSRAAPSWDSAPVRAPSQAMSDPFSRSASPSGPSRSAVPSNSAPSRSYSPSNSAPSRSYSPSNSAPSRSYSPSNSAPSRSYSPSHSSPSRSYSPSHSSPSRSYSPSHSSPSRSFGGGGGGGGGRSSGGGGGGRSSGGGGGGGGRRR